MKIQKMLLSIILVIVFFAALNGLVAQEKNIEIRGVDFKFSKDISKLEIKLSGEAEFDKQVSEADKQVIIQIKNAKILKKFEKKLDTSSFKTNVSLISPYQSDNDVRVVLQLRESGDVQIKKEGNTLVALIDNSQSKAPTEAVTQEPTASSDSSDSVSTGQGSESTVEAFTKAQQDKKYRGRPLYLQVSDTDIRDVFRAISEAGDLNIIAGEEVRGRVTMNLTDVPWDQALDLVLQSNHLAAERSGNILRITTVDNLQKEKQAQITVKKAEEATEPLVVKIFPISYAKIDDIKKILEDFLSKEIPTGPNSELFSVANAPKRGSIQVDQRTNALVVRDTASTMEKIKKLINELDTQTPQVLIEAKFVEVKETKNKEVHGRVFSTSREFDAGSDTFSFKRERNQFGALFSGSAGAAANGGQLLNNFAISPVAGASFGFAPRTTLIPGIREISAFLSILETEESAKVIASPRVVAQNKEAADISQGQVIQLPTTPGANSAGSFVTVNATLKLQVTPQVTNDGNINLKISFSQESPSATSASGGSLTTDTKQVNTSVLVDSGATLVIGGIYSSNFKNSASGIPILRDIPIIGYLFGSKGSTVNKNELFIFLTPRIINEKESGLRG